MANQTTRVPINDLRRGGVALRADLSVAFERFLESGWYVLGPEHAAFEDELADYLGVMHCVGVASGKL